MERKVLERKIEWEREMREREKKHLKSYWTTVYLCVFIELDAATEQVTVELSNITEDQSNSDSEGNQCK